METIAGRCAPCKSESYNQVARNITNMKNNAREFFSKVRPEDPFLLYVGSATPTVAR